MDIFSNFDFWHNIKKPAYNPHLKIQILNGTYCSHFDAN